MAVFLVILSLSIVQLLPSPSNAQATCLQGDIRLRDGVNHLSGRLEICYNNAWGTVCGDGWSGRNAEVACRQLGFAGYRNVLRGSNVVEGGGQIVLDDVSCRGNESRLVDCSHSKLGSHSCRFNAQIGVSCFEASNSTVGCPEGDIRLRDGVNTSSGRVEVCYNNVWGSFCGNYVSRLNAYVACRQLGFAGLRSVLTGSDVVAGSGPIFLDSVNCRGNESRLIDCQHRARVDRDYDIYCTDAGVSCLEACEGADISLVGGRITVAGGEPIEYNGFVEVCTNNTQGSVCDRSWTAADAAVVCRQLGYSELGAIPRRNTSYRLSVLPALLGDVVCNGSESQLVDCQHPRLGHQSCSTLERVGVSCQPPGTEPMCRDGDVRLVASSSYSREHLRLQFCYGRVWGAVCYDNFDDAAATVVCRQLGLASVGTADYSFYDSLPFVYNVLSLDSIGCTGDERQLTECSAYPLGLGNPSTSSIYCSGEAGVRCLPGILVVQKLSGGEIFAILFCSYLFVGSIIVFVLGVVCYKQRQYKKLVRTHSSSDSSSDRHPPTTSETAQRVEQVGVATPADSAPSQDRASDPPPPETDHPEQGLIRF